MICALDNKGWPPHTYFGELEEELSKLPWVELTLTDRGKPSIGPLERYIDKKLDEQMVSICLTLLADSGGFTVLFFSSSYHWRPLPPFGCCSSTVWSL